MKSTPPVVIIPNWNGHDLLGECLESLSNQTEPAKIIVVDNGSEDGSQELIKTQFPGVELIELDRNYGFAGGVNAGIKKALEDGAEFIALFNNDAVADKDWVKNLVVTIQKSPEAGIVTSKFMRLDKKHLDSTGDFYTVWGLPFPRGRNEVDSGQYDEQLEIFGASGGASLYRTEMFKKIGLFDDGFFAYFEDVDISFRAQLAGWKVAYSPAAVAYHHVNATSSKLGNFNLYHSVKNFILTYAKNMPSKLCLKYLPLFILQYLRWLITSTFRGHLITFLRGTFAALRLYKSTYEKRKIIQKSRTVSVEYIDSMLYHHRPPKPPIIEKAT